jgi:hypothetical protein
MLEVEKLSNDSQSRNLIYNSLECQQLRVPARSLEALLKRISRQDIV